MQGEFEMSMMGELNFFLGLQIKQTTHGTFVSQTKYCQELLKHFGMTEAKTIDTIMEKNGNLEKDHKCKDVDVTQYRGTIGSLPYLTGSRPDNMFSLCVCARYQSSP